MEHIIINYNPTKILNDVIVFDDDDNVLECVQVIYDDIEDTVKDFQKTYKGADILWQ